MNAVARHWDVFRSAVAQEKARGRGLGPVEEVTFLPAALEIVERPVSPTARTTTWVLLLGLVLTVAWLTLGRVDVIASAPGRLIPADNVKLVQPSEAGIVRAILVRDGQRVRKGQPLVELDPTVSTADAVQAESALETARLDAARARAVLSALGGGALHFQAPPGTSPDTAATQIALARAQLADLLARNSTQVADHQGTVAALGEAEAQARKLTETLPLLDEQIAANEQLLSKGYVSRLRVIEMRRQRLATVRDRDAALEAVRRARAQIAGSSGRGAQSSAESRAQVLGELAKADAEARLRQEELVKARKRSNLQVLTSPVDGTITQLGVHTLGGVVEPAKPIMVVVPNGVQLIAEVKLLNKDVGFVRAGQEVTLKLEAFPFTRYGTVSGRIESISSDAVEDQKLGLVYSARISLDRQVLGRAGDAHPLAPGMAATADVRTGKRSILSYLVSPIDAARQEAGRER